MWRYLVWSLRLRRVEYRIAELPIFLVPVLLVIPDASALLSAAFWEGLIIFLFLLAFGDLLNCLADRDLDAIYKPHLTEAVYGLGVRGVIVQATLSAVAAFALTIHLAWLLQRWLLVPVVLVGLFVAYAYSVEPFRLKSRGLWQLGFYWLGLFTGPMLFAALLFDPWPAGGVLLVAVFYGLMQTGVILVNTAEDYPEDRQLGVRTVIVALGLTRGMRLAVVLVVLGGLGLVASFLVLFVQRQLPVVLLVALVPLVLSAGVVTCTITAVARRVGQVEESKAIEAVKRSAVLVPLWITALAVSSLLAASVWCFGRPAASHGPLVFASWWAILGAFPVAPMESDPCAPTDASPTSSGR
jgi:4-hydroxybenzoate polyprenyltransferase